jgi:hypothetical protein
MVKPPPYSFLDRLLGRVPKNVAVFCMDCGHEENFTIGRDSYEVKVSGGREPELHNPDRPPKRCPKCGSSKLKTHPGPPLIH